AALDLVAVRARRARYVLDEPNPERDLVRGDLAATERAERLLGETHALARDHIGHGRLVELRIGNAHNERLPHVRVRHEERLDLTGRDHEVTDAERLAEPALEEDRKSTRLNSSHVAI